MRTVLADVTWAGNLCQFFFIMTILYSACYVMLLIRNSSLCFAVNTFLISITGYGLFESANLKGTKTWPLPNIIIQMHEDKQTDYYFFYRGQRCCFLKLGAKVKQAKNDCLQFCRKITLMDILQLLDTFLFGSTSLFWRFKQTN